ncbi:hypothetical protein ACJJTC_012867 [Scirpophaga incertulas]
MPKYTKKTILASQARELVVHDFVKEAIRNHIYEFYRRMELPTLLKLLNTLKGDDFKKGITSLRHVIKDIGVVYKNVDKPNIAIARCTFLRKVKNKSDWSKVVFLDETWLNAKHTVGKSWNDITAQSCTNIPPEAGRTQVHSLLITGWLFK